MFQDEYRKAYDKITIEPTKLQELLLSDRQDNAKSRGRFFYRIRPIAIFALSFCLVCSMALPALAREIPDVYRVIVQYAPALAEYILPQNYTSISKGIVLQVEAVNVDANRAEVILSFRDEEESLQNQITGKADLYNSYRIYNYGEKGVTGGCSFLTYDETEGKAYFKVDITSDVPFNKNKMKLSVSRLLTNCTEEERRIGLDDRIEEPKDKIVEYNGVGGKIETRKLIPFFADRETFSGRIVRVMDVVKWEESLAESLTVTGIAYDEGVLRIQQCRGNFSEADRHIRLYLKDEEGKERIPDSSVGWKEEINGEEILFDEHWFLISEEELKQYDLYGMFYITDGCVEGEWEVTVNLDE